MNNYKSITMIGCGAWATTVANLLAKQGHHVCIWAHRQGIVDEINSHHQREKLPNIILDQRLFAESDLEKALSKADAIICCVASPFFMETIERWKPYYDKKIPVLSLTKGIVDPNKIFISELFSSLLPDIQLATLSGPNLAIEIAEGKPAASVVASTDDSLCLFFQELLSSGKFRVYTSIDHKGVQLGGILKNVMALASGCCDALELGMNAKSTLLARGLQEMIRLAKFYNAQEKTLMGLSGLGDLIATCNSSKSRNYQVGYQLGKGVKIHTILNELNAVAEGVNTCRKIHHIAKEHQVSMPITTMLFNIIEKGLAPELAIEQLMTRELKPE